MGLFNYKEEKALLSMDSNMKSFLPTLNKDFSDSVG